ncbi:ATP-binding cassette domain-containing protein [Actinoplanes sp. NPDC049802]|uniref:ATP-binding cassette domain-containing protein n=1 Tax=Actinoplanes sp. NPDC049802 TaxID=3154742 RepID=UPI00340C836F
MDAAVVGHGLELRHRSAVVFQDLDVRVGVGGMLVLAGPARAGKTALLLTLAGRMRATGGKLTVSGFALPREASRVRRVVALAELAKVNPLDDTLTVEQQATEAIVLAAPWYRPWARAAEIDAVLSTARALAGEIPARSLICDLDPAARLLFGVALALVPARAAGSAAVLAVDDVDLLRDVEDRRRVWAALSSLAGSGEPPLTVIAACQNHHELTAIEDDRVVIVDLERC